MNKFKIIRIILFIALSGFLMYMGYYPNSWKFWAVIVCAGGISVTEYLESKSNK